MLNISRAKRLARPRERPWQRLEAFAKLLQADWGGWRCWEALGGPGRPGKALGGPAKMLEFWVSTLLRSAQGFEGA